MNDWIRMDTDETLDLARQLERLSEEMDRAAMRVRMLEQHLYQPEEASAALYEQRRRIRLLMEKTDRLAARLKQIAELFGGCEEQIRGWINAHADGYLYRKNDLGLEE